MFLKTIFTTIPKSVNEIIFVLGLLGIVLPFAKNERDRLFQRITLIIIFFMVIWRALYQIESSRYASGLILPFTIGASYLIFKLNHLKSNSIVLRIVFPCLLFLVVVLWVKKDFQVSAVNQNINRIVDVHARMNKKADTILITPHNDMGRLKYYGSSNRQWVEPYFLEQNHADLSNFIEKFKTVNYRLLYDIVVRSGDTSKVSAKTKDAKYKQVLSLFAQKNKKKKHCVYLIESKGSYRSVSSHDMDEFDSGLLQNGDLEKLDSPERSYEKLKKHITYYEDFYVYDPSIRTPENAYFFNNQAVTHYRPFYTCTSENAISGKSSAYIRINAEKEVSYFLFYQRFHNGKYHYSFQVKGKKGTKVCLLYDMNQDKKYEVRPLAYFVLPNTQTYDVQTVFSVDTLAKDDFFLVGAWVYNGEAYLDNFKLDRIDN